MLKDTEI